MWKWFMVVEVEVYVYILGVELYIMGVWALGEYQPFSLVPGVYKL